MVAISCQAPTWTFVRLQPLEHQLSFAKAIVLHLGASTPKDSNPFNSEAPTLWTPTVTWYKLFCCSSMLPSLLSFCFTLVFLLLLPLPELQLPLALIIRTHSVLSLFFLFYVFLMPLAVCFRFPLALRLPQRLLQLPLRLLASSVSRVALASSALACSLVSQLFMSLLDFFVSSSSPTLEGHVNS